jgi:uncharacterized oxidoreductase
MALFDAQPTPPEILVQRVHNLRFAEAEGRFDEAANALNEMVRKTRAAQQ